MRMNTEFVDMSDKIPDALLIQDAQKIISDGGLVVFPTETVYGIACRVMESSLDKLNNLKNRPADKRYTLHVGNTNQIPEYLPRIPYKLKRFMEKALPGPLTVVAGLDEGQLAELKMKFPPVVFDKLYSEGTLGIRCPENDIAEALLSGLDFPVVAPSANISGEAPATTGKKAAEYFDSKLEMIIDGGSCRYNQSSTVVSFENDQINILREGVMKRDEIESLSDLVITFVCTGNTCRSPLAEGLCKKMLAEKKGCSVEDLERKGYKICSAGVMAVPGMPASREVVQICELKGIDIKSHLSRGLNETDIEKSDIIFVMGSEHLERIAYFYPWVVDKCFVLDKNRDIADPIGGDMDVYGKCCVDIEGAMLERFGEFSI